MKRIFILLIASLSFAPFFADAAALSFEMPKTASKGEEIVVSVVISTGGDKLNAISGSISFDSSRLEVKATNEGSSPITLWIERPRIVASVGGSSKASIDFSGIAPGGFQGTFAIFSFIAKPLVSGRVGLSASSLLAYANNGQGTPVTLAFQPGRATSVSGTGTTTVLQADSVPPEEFSPIVSASKDIFSGKPFISWNAQDKGTGISHYEIAYAVFSSPAEGSWKPAQSPMELDHGSLYKNIFIKAVDKQGNERIASVAGPNRYKTFAFWGIIIAIALCVFRLNKRRSS